MKDIIKKVTVTNHNHPKDQYDAVDNIKDMFNAMISAGYRVIGVTDHGCFSGMQTMLDLAVKYNKEHDNDKCRILYGIEAYVEIRQLENTVGYSIPEKVAHFVLYAKNRDGQIALNKAISHTNTYRMGAPVILWDEFAKLAKSGNVCGTTACIAGLPASQLLINEFVDKKVAKIQNKVAELLNPEEGDATIMSPTDPIYVGAVNNLKRAWEKVEVLTAKANAYAEKTKPELKCLRADKRKLDKAGESSVDVTAKIDEIIETAQLNKQALSDAKKAVTAARKPVTELKKKVEKYESYQSTINHLLSKKDTPSQLQEKAKAMLIALSDLFGDDLFVEVQNHGIETEAYVYRTLADIADELGLKLIAANDTHMATKSQASIDKRNVAKFLRFENIEESEADNELYVKTPEELAEALLKILSEDQVKRALINLDDLAERCQYTPVKEAHYPVYDRSRNSNEVLRETAYAGVKWRYPNGEGWDEAHQKRLEYELDVIISMGFADYHLIVKDFIEYAALAGKLPEKYLAEAPLTIPEMKEYVKKYGTVGIGVGPGRGSGAGSLVTYCLGITNIDPFKFGLVFERFLNPERVSMPDIDTDIANGVREKTIEYVRHKYGDSAVVGIVTETRQGVKGGIRDAARYLERKHNALPKTYTSIGDQIRKKIPEAPGVSYNTLVAENQTLYDMLIQEYQGNKIATEIIELSRNLEGMLVGFGQHAAGVIIYDNDDINEYIPTKRGKLGTVTECDMIQAEAIGLLKMDFLGLKTLNVLTEAARLVKNTKGIDIDIDAIPMEGPEAQLVYKEIFAKGRTKNVFQFESPGMRKYLKELMK